MRVGAFLLALAVWQVISLWYPPLLLPSPIETAEALKDLLLHGDLLGRFWFSIQALLIGLSLAIGAGVVLGLVMGSFPRVDRLIAPYLDALYVTPHVMLIPVFIIWFGIDTKSRVAFIFINAYFPVVINTLVGVRTTRGELSEMARAFGAGRLAMIRRVYLPGSVPMMLAGIRLGLGRGIVAMITAEMFLAVVGVGFLVVSYGNRLQTADVFALAVFVSVFGVVVTRLVGYLGRKLAPWSDDSRAN